MSHHRQLRRILAACFVACALAPGSGLAEGPAPAPAPTLTRPPKLVKFVEAVYPEAEEAAGKTAVVVLALVIGADGKIEEATVHESGGAGFDAAALAAARAFVFEPALIDDKPARIRILYRYEFVLKQAVPTTGALHGVVRDRKTKRPLAGVRIEAEGVGEAVTDAEGRFAFDALPPGRLRLTLRGDRLAPTVVTEEVTVGKQVDARYDVALTEPVAAGEEDDLEIVVKAPAMRREAVSTEVSAEAARKLPGTQGDVLRVVENLPGVARAAAGSGQLVVWGAAPEDTRVFVDGVPVPRLYHDGGLRSILPSEQVASVELTPGGYGPAYGRGLGGLVTVTSRPLEGPGVHGALSLDLYDAAASLRAALGKRVHLGVALRRSHLDSVLSLVDPRVTQFFPVPRYWDGQLRLAIQLGPRRTLEFSGLVSIDELSRGRPSVDPVLAARETRGVQFYRLSARYRHQLAGGSVVSVIPFIGFDRNRLALDVGGTRAGVDSDALLFGVRASWRGRVARWLTLEVGLDAEVRRTSLLREGALALPAREGDVRVFGQPPPDSLTADRWTTLLLGVAPYAEADVGLFGDKLHIVPGLRLDPYVRSTSRKTPAIGETPEIGLLENDFRIEPRLTIRYSPHPVVSLKAATGLYHQPPVPDDLSAVFGNPALSSAEVVHALGGIALRPHKVLTIEATGFYTQSDRLAVRSPAASPLLAQALVATGQGRSYGGQLLVRLDPLKGIYGWISYTAMRSERRSDGEAAWRLFDFDQTHLFTLVAAYLLPRGFEIGVRLRVASGYPRTPIVGAAYDAQRDIYQPIFGRHNSDRIPVFVQLDARVGKTFRLGPTSLELYLDVQNVTNQGNAEEIVYNHDFTERGFITGLPVTPVLGAKWLY
jgi:TonB family protein